MERQHEKWTRYFHYQSLGTQYYDNGDKYEGEWKDDQRVGRGSSSSNRLGIMVYANGDRYEGDWKDDLKEGQGKTLR